MMITKKGFNWYVIDDIVKGYLVTRTYLYYTKKEAINKFKNEVLK